MSKETYEIDKGEREGRGGGKGEEDMEREVVRGKVRDGSGRGGGERND